MFFLALTDERFKGKDYVKRIMKIGLILVTAVAIGAIAAALIFWREANTLRATNSNLQLHLETLRQQTAQIQDEARKREEELSQARKQAEDVNRLRGEVRQLRSVAREAEALRSKIQEPKSAPTPGVIPSNPPPTATVSRDSFPRENWAYAGLATPESALQSAIWAMKEGNPKTYFECLAPEEQERRAKSWENKSEAEIAAKHQQDVSAITGLKILERQVVSDDEQRFHVYLEGVGRMEQVAIKKMGNDWKIAGNVREQKK